MKQAGKIYFALTAVIILTITIVISLYARGYRLNRKELELQPNGILVMKSHPDGAQIFINGELKNVTDSTLRLQPNTYDVVVRKDGYMEWNKRIIIEKEAVTEITAHLFRSAPSLSAITFSGVINPVPSPDMSKLIYTVPPGTNNENGTDEAGLWIIETLDLPLGFSRDPKRITDGNLIESSYRWSPNGREILLTTKTGNFILDAGEFTPQNQRVNIISLQLNLILQDWEKDSQKKLNEKLKKLPDELENILKRNAKEIVFSPDEKMVLFTASGSATIKESLKKPLPGSSTQPEKRELQKGYTYVYDIEEDKNFLIDENDESLVIVGGIGGDFQRRISWFATSRHLVLTEPNKITIMDYDGTNRKEVYSGIYVSPNAYPTVSIERLLILTNLGADSAPSNIYTLGLK